MNKGSDDIYSSMPVAVDFVEAVKAGSYRALPDDWVVGFSDVMGSTEAVSQGRYKAVNMVGAGVIAAVSNALRRRPFPFVFGGDGASFAVGPSDASAAREALRAMAIYSREAFQLSLRIAMTDVATIRAAGHDVRVARFGASKDCAYAMFSGGGLTWLEKEAKRGAFALAEAEPGTMPDLSGLTCRWGVSPAKHGMILSVIVSPRGTDPRYFALVEEIVSEVATMADAGRPVTLESLRPNKPADAISFESLTRRASGASRAAARVAAAALYGLGYVFFRWKLNLGDFKMEEYMASLVTNADFRKFDDGLRMTLDCSPDFADRLEKQLAEAADYVHYGTFRQTNAIVGTSHGGRTQ